ncbi:tyrosine-type recombinase/integrase [Gordonia sp. VNK21]|uniref:tyrosine-type recombinase/integrase n=1 Tax=Gordonia sp. VNK21 TaxID=3382483 RepID=UPI0038D44532
MRVQEATVGHLDVFLRSLSSASVRAQCRVVLAGMMKLAAQHDAIDHNPVRETTKARRDHVQVRALTVADFHRLRARIAAWAGGNTSGPKRGTDLPDMFDVMAGTGARIGEVLALRWDDVQFSSGRGKARTPATATIAGTVIDDGTRQPFPKSHSSARTMVLPDFAEAALRRQRGRRLPSEDGLVFPSRTGGPRTAANTRRQLRQARRTVPAGDGGPADEFDWVSPHVLRKTAATLIEGEMGMESAARQLGHASPEVTRTHYVARPEVGPDVRNALDVLAPVASVSDGFRGGDARKRPSTG